MEAIHNSDAAVCNCTPPCVYDAGEINDDHCEHGVHVDDHHGCAECAAGGGDWLGDQMKEGM